MDGLRVAGVVSVLAAGAAVAWLALRPTVESEMRRVCAEAIREMVASPSSVNILAVEAVTVGRASQDEFMGWENPRRKAREVAMVASGTDRLAELARTRLDLYRAGTWTAARALVSFEAANVYGTPMRNRAVCKIVGNRGGFPVGARASDVRLDGDTAVDRALDALGAPPGN